MDFYPEAGCGPSTEFILVGNYSCPEISFTQFRLAMLWKIKKSTIVLELWYDVRCFYFILTFLAAYASQSYHKVDSDKQQSLLFSKSMCHVTLYCKHDEHGKHQFKELLAVQVVSRYHIPSKYSTPSNCSTLFFHTYYCILKFYTFLT